MSEYLLNHVGIFAAGDHLHGTAAVLAGIDIDISSDEKMLNVITRVYESEGVVGGCGH
jgi:hypothetical protein